MPVLDNPRHERFAQELASGKSASEAFVKAGYKKNDGNAIRLKGNEKVQARLGELLGKAAKKVELDKEWVISRLMENANRAMQAQQVLDSEGKPTGEFRYNGAVANRALELLGKEIGMFIDRHEIGDPGGFARMSDDELRKFIAERIGECGEPAMLPVPRKPGLH